MTGKIPCFIKIAKQCRSLDAFMRSFKAITTTKLAAKYSSII